MSEILGYNGTIEVSSDGGTVYVSVGEVLDADLNDESDKLDSTSNDDAGWKAEINGLRAVSLSFTCHYDVADAGQNKIRTAQEAGTSLNWRFRPEGNNAGKREHTFVGTPVVNSTFPTAAIADMTVDVRSSGVVTSTTL
jgi:predicted secreted protein